MKKIKTIFDRDWKGKRGVINSLVVDEIILSGCFATEKVDGTNIRLTIRSGQVVRVEKRKNPSKEQKTKGIIEPWYIDAKISSSNDKWIFDAVFNTDFSNIEDGVFSGEAFGKNIQGNPLGIDNNKVFLFGHKETLNKAILKDVPLSYDELKYYLQSSKSLFNNTKQIEGIVWHNAHGDKFKIKLKDFK